MNTRCFRTSPSRSLSFLKKIVNRPFKIVHAHSPFTSGLAAAHVAKLRNIPMVATFHSKYRDDFSRVIKSKFVVNRIVKRLILLRPGR